MPIDSAVALVSLDEMKRYMKIPPPGTDELDVLADLINDASAWASSYTGRNFLQANYTEFYDGDGSNMLILNNYPVVSLTSINDDPARVFGASSNIDISIQVQIRKDSGVVRLWTYAFNQGSGNVKVVYSAGYPLASVPYDLRLAVKKIVADQYRHGFSAGHVGIKAENIGDKSITFSEEAMPKDAKDILDGYRIAHAAARSFA